MITAGLIVTTLSCKKGKIEVDDSFDDQQNGANGEPSLEPLLENLPEGTSSLTRINITVKGDSIANYIYKVGVADQLDCSNPTGYSLNGVGTPIDVDISQLPDGPIALCLVAQHDNQAWQNYDRAKRFQWQKSTGAIPSADNLRLIHGSEQLTLFWDDVASGEGYLAIRQVERTDWQPKNGVLYNVGEVVADNILILANGPGSTLVDADLTNNQSYHYSVFTYDSNRNYSPPSTVSGIPSLASFTWLRLQPGAYLENAVVAGTRYDGSSDLYVCRGMIYNPAGQVTARLPGKFVPAKKGDPSAGNCYIPGNRTITDIELLVITDGTFESELEWILHAASNSVPVNSLISGNDLDESLFTCRFKIGTYFIPGSHALNQACRVDAFGAPNNTAGSEGFEILTIKP